MKVERDYEELLKLFNKNKVKYCIIGAYAVAIHAKPRYTKDIDILVEPSIENAERIIKSLNEFGFKSLNLSRKDFSKKDRVVQLGYEPIRIDIMTSIPKTTFKQVWKNKIGSVYGKEKVFFIGLNELINNKKASHRKQDLVDLDVLLSKRKNKK